MRAIARWLGAGIGALALALPVPAGAVGADQSGWWWRAQPGLLVEVPAPPQVPEGGLYVEGAPDGPSAVSALRFRVPEGASASALVLKVAQEQGGEQAVILACPSGGPWVPAQAGRWEARPPGACDGQGVLGQRADDGSTWTFPLMLMPARDVLDVVLVAGTDDARPEGLNGSVFSVAFEPPGPGTLVVEQGGGESTPPVGPPPVFTPPPDGGGAPPVFGGTPESPPVGEPAPQVEDPSVITPRVSTPAPSAEERTASAPPSRDARALATLIALVSVGVAGVLSRDRLVTVPGLPARATGDEREGGIGRFRRPRSSPPPPL